MKSLTLILLCLSINTFAQKNDIIHIDNLPTEGVLLDKGWKFHTGDNPAWAKADFDDSAWAGIDPTKDILSLPQLPKSGEIVWLRLRLALNDTIKKALCLMLQQSGASDMYLNGQLTHQFGHISHNPLEIQAYDPLFKPFLFPANKDSFQTLAIRYTLQPNVLYTTIFEAKNPVVWAKLTQLEDGIEHYEQHVSRFKTFIFFLMGAFALIAILHLSFYNFYRAQKANLYFGIFSLLFVFVNALHYMYYLDNHEVVRKFYTGNITMIIIDIAQFLLLTAVYILLEKKKDIIYWLLFGYVFVSTYLNLFVYDIGWRIGGALIILLIALNTARVAYLNLKTNKRGSKILLGGTIAFFMFFAVFLAQNIIHNDFIFLTIQRLVIYICYSLSIPVAISFYLGVDFAFINQQLTLKLKEVEDLSHKTIIQEQEKQLILSTQNETLEKQVAERTSELHQSLETLKATQSQLIQKEKLASLGELTAGIAHEIQNPLNFVNNFSELSVDLAKELNEEIDKELIDKGLVKEILSDLSSNQEKINHHGKRASSIVKGMLEHSRASTGVKEMTVINKLADEYLRLSYHGLRAKDKEFNADFELMADPNLPRIEVIPQDIGRVLLNLINNAFYAVHQRKQLSNDGSYTPSTLSSWSPTVFVTTQHIDNQIIIKVKDNGTGMPESVRAKVFQPFFTTKPTGSGTGLGLSLAYDIVTKGHGGSLEVESTEGIGTEFMITLPFKNEK
jgi:two-component system, NtrC family, sensor kinase